MVKEKTYRIIIGINTAVLVLLIGLFIIGITSQVIKIDIPTYEKNAHYKIQFSPEVLQQLNGYFNSTIEHGICLDGYQKELNNYYLNSITAVYDGNKTSIWHPVCNTMADYHNHPKDNNPFTNSCYASKGDVDTWKLYAPYGVTLFIIQCDYNKFIYYTPEDFYHGVIYEVK